MSDKFCECETVGAVARDMKSTCAKCGGIDAYKKSTLRPSTAKMNNIEQIKEWLGSPGVIKLLHSGDDCSKLGGGQWAISSVDLLEFLDSLSVESDKVLMPVEPTEELIIAMMQAPMKHAWKPEDSYSSVAEVMYKAMIKSII